MLVFVYGTLTDPEQAAAVLDEWAFEGSAALSGLHRAEGEYPTLAPGGQVEGRLLRTTEVRRLDAYEGLERGLYARGSVPVVGDAVGRDEKTAEVYVGDPDRLRAPATWAGQGNFDERVSAYVEENEVVVRLLEDERQ